MGGLFFGVTAGRRPFPLQIAAKIGGDTATTVNNNTPDFGFGGQKRQLEDGGKRGMGRDISKLGRGTLPNHPAPFWESPNGASSPRRPAGEQEAGGAGRL